MVYLSQSAADYDSRRALARRSLDVCPLRIATRWSVGRPQGMESVCQAGSGFGADIWLAPVGTLMTFYWVCISWVFFRANSFGAALTVLRSFVLLRSLGSQQLNVELLGVFAVLACLHWLTAREVWTQAVERIPTQLFAVGYGFAVAVLLTLVPVGYTPFIYFQF